MSSEDGPVALLARFYEAESGYLADQGDFGPMAETLDRECVMVQPDSLPYGGQWQGHQGYQDWLQAFGQAWASLSVQGSHIYAAEADTVFSRSTVVGTARATGREITYPLLQMITIRDGRILRIEPFYWDTHQVLVAFGDADR